MEDFMKNILQPAIALLAGIVLSQVVLPMFALGQELDRRADRKATPLACDRLALSPEQRKRHFDELGPALRARRTTVRELADGFEFSFPGDPATFQLLTEWIAGERICCPFFAIALRAEPGDGPLWLSLTGKDGVKQFMEAEGSVWFKP